MIFTGWHGKHFCLTALQFDPELNPEPYNLCVVWHVSPMSMWVSFGVFSPKNHADKWIGYFILPLGVNVCMDE